MGINEEVIETKRFHQLAKAFGEQVDFVALTQDPRNLACFDARGDQIEDSSCRRVRTHLTGYIIGRLLNAAPTMQVIVEGQAHLLRVHAKEDMQTR